MKNVLTLLLLLISATGCASKTPFDLAQQGPTMKDNYEQHMAGVDAPVNSGGVMGSSGVGRALEGDINYQAVGEYAYGRLQNPEMEMFIYPHRSTRHGVIVPGYSVRFPMYEKVQYGLVRDVANVE